MNRKTFVPLGRCIFTTSENFHEPDKVHWTALKGYTSNIDVSFKSSVLCFLLQTYGKFQLKRTGCLMNLGEVEPLDGFLAALHQDLANDPRREGRVVCPKKCSAWWKDRI